MKGFGFGFGFIKSAGSAIASTISWLLSTSFDNTLEESKLGLDAGILPATGLLSSTSYATRQDGTNIGSGASSGYVEALVYNPQQGGLSDDSYGALYLFELNDVGFNGRRFTVYLSDSRFSLDAYDSSAVRRIVNSNITSHISKGWHTLRLESDGSTYSMFIDGVEQTSLNVSSGTNDGVWTDSLHAGVDGVSIGILRQATEVPSSMFAHGYVAYVDFNGTNKWILNTPSGYIYDIIGGKHLEWQNVGQHMEYTDHGSNYLATDGYSLWQNSGSDDIQVPYSSTGTAISLTPGTDIPTGYTKTKDVAGSSTVWNKSFADVDFRHVALSGGHEYDVNYAVADMNTNSGTRTYFIRYNHSKIGVTGTLRKLRFMYTHSANTSAFKLQIWRKVSGTYTLIHNVDILSLLGTGTGIIEPVLATPLAVVEGDFIALCITNSSADNILTEAPSGSITNSTVYVDSEQTTGYDWETSPTGAAANLVIQPFIDAPVLSVLGDSIVAGRPGYASIIEGYLDLLDRTNQISYQIEAIDSIFTYINFGFGGATLDDIYEYTQFAIDAKPAYVLMNGGTNDVAGGETDNSIIVADYEQIVDMVNAAGIPVIAMSVIPYTNGTNTQGQQIDALNALLETMMSGKTGIFVDLTTTIGLFRAGGDAGNLWDLQVAYDADGVHMTVAGCTAAAGKIYAEFAASYALPDRSKTDNLDRSDTTIASAASSAADSYDAGNPYQFRVEELTDKTTLDSYFETDYQGQLSVTSTDDTMDKITNTVD